MPTRSSLSTTQPLHGDSFAWLIATPLIIWRLWLCGSARCSSLATNSCVSRSPAGEREMRPSMRRDFETSAPAQFRMTFPRRSDAPGVSYSIRFSRRAPTRPGSLRSTCATAISWRRRTNMKAPLTETHPELAAQWHPLQDFGLSAAEVSCGSSRRARWRCDEGHDWVAVVNSRARGNGCPYCAGRRVLKGYNDLATRSPELATQWHPVRNLDLTASEVTAYSDKRVWWLGECGHEWSATVGSRSNGNGCSVCHGLTILVGFNDLKSQRPDVAASWHPTLIEPLNPDQGTVSTIRKTWWMGDCGHSWRAPVSERSAGRNLSR